MRCSIITYNVRTIKLRRRREHIVRDFRRSHLLGLPGIQGPEEVVRSNVNQFVWMDFPSRGWSAGVALAFKRTVWQERNIRDNFLPLGEFRGRFAAVRLVRKGADLCLISLYMWVEPQQDAQQNRNRRFWLWLGHFIEQLPARCVPIICTDSNGHVGLERWRDGQFVQNSSSRIGTHNSEPVNFNEEHLLQFMEHQHLSAANTYTSLGPTYYGPPSGHRNTRIDYIIVPSARLRNIIWSSIPWPAATRLQSIAAPGFRYHVPIHVTADFGLQYTHLRLRSAVWTRVSLCKVHLLEQSVMHYWQQWKRNVPNTTLDVITFHPQTSCGKDFNPLCQKQLQTCITLYDTHRLDHQKQMLQLRTWFRQEKLSVPFGTVVFQKQRGGNNQAFFWCEVVRWWHALANFSDVVKKLANKLHWCAPQRKHLSLPNSTTHTVFETTVVYMLWLVFCPVELLDPNVVNTTFSNCLVLRLLNGLRILSQLRPAGGCNAQVVPGPIFLG